MEQDSWNSQERSLLNEIQKLETMIEQTDEENRVSFIQYYENLYNELSEELTKAMREIPN